MTREENLNRIHRALSGIPTQSYFIVKPNRRVREKKRTNPYDRFNQFHIYNLAAQIRKANAHG